jgi:hypothetical protein
MGKLRVQGQVLGDSETQVDIILLEFTQKLNDGENVLLDYKFESNCEFLFFKLGRDM